jgi:hypothetical protein
VFFKRGPFAWNGLLAWWLVLVAYFLWITVTSIALVRAVKRDPGDAEYPNAAATNGHGARTDDALAAEVAQLRRDLDRLSTGSAT